MHCTVYNKSMCSTYIIYVKSYIIIFYLLVKYIKLIKIAYNNKYISTSRFEQL